MLMQELYFHQLRRFHALSTSMSRGPRAQRAGGSPKSLTCLAVAWPGVLGSREPHAADVLPLPLPWPGEGTHSSQLLCTDRRRDENMVKGKKKSSFFPTES